MWKISFQKAEINVHHYRRQYHQASHGGTQHSLRLDSLSLEARDGFGTWYKMRCFGKSMHHYQNGVMSLKECQVSDEVHRYG